MDFTETHRSALIIREPDAVEDAGLGPCRYRAFPCNPWLLLISRFGVRVPGGVWPQIAQKGTDGHGSSPGVFDGVGALE